MERVVRHWSRLARQVVNGLSLDEALGNVISWKVCLPVAGCLELDAL